MDALLQARLGQLERQAAHFASLADRQAALLADVRGALAAGDVAQARKLVHAPADARPNSAHSAAPAPLAAAPAAFAVDDAQLQATAVAVADRIQQAVVRLLNVWFEHLARKVERLLEEPLAKFQLFHDAPTEDSLADFMDAFHDCAKAVVALLQPQQQQQQQQSSSAGVAQLGPSGNPFQMDDRLHQLFVSTIVDGFAPLLGAQPSHAAAAVSRPSEPPPPMMATRRPDPPPQQQQAPPPPPPPVALRPPSFAIAGLGGAGAAALAAAGRPSSALGSGGGGGHETPRTMTRRFDGGAANDSSQVRSAIFFDAAATIAAAGAMRPARPGTRSHDSSSDATTTQQQQLQTPQTQQQQQQRVAALHQAMEQLEFQLAGAAMNRRDSGSEAKYYAVAKRLQKVRAEVLREQREQSELANVREARESERAFKEGNRRHFRR